MYHLYVIASVLICVSAPMSSEDVSRTDETLQENIGALLQRFSEEDRRVVRNIEAARKKRIHAQYAVLFNEFC